MEACEILAEVSVEGLVYMGDNPVAGTYVCIASTANPYTGSVSPYICKGVMTATAVGKTLGQSEALKELTKKAAEAGCTVAVDFAQEKAKIILFKAKQNYQQNRRAFSETKRKVSALNSYEGISWLMRYMSGGR